VVAAGAAEVHLGVLAKAEALGVLAVVAVADHFSQGWDSYRALLYFSELPLSLSRQ